MQVMTGFYVKSKEQFKHTIDSHFIEQYIRTIGIDCMCSYFVDERNGVVNCVYRERCRQGKIPPEGYSINTFLKFNQCRKNQQQPDWFCKTNHENGIKKLPVTTGVFLYVFTHLSEEKSDSEIDHERIKNFITFFKNAVCSCIVNDYLQTMAFNMDIMQKISNPKDRIFLQVDDSIKPFHPDLLMNISASGCYSILRFYKTENIVVSKSLSKVELSLKRYPNFYRIHRSTIVNVHFMHHVLKNQYFEVGGARFEIAARTLSAFREYLLGSGFNS